VKNRGPGEVGEEGWRKEMPAKAQRMKNKAHDEGRVSGRDARLLKEEAEEEAQESGRGHPDK